MKKILIPLILLAALGYFAYQYFLSDIEITTPFTENSQVPKEERQQEPRENFGAIEHFDTPDLIVLSPLVYPPSSTVPFLIHDFDGNTIPLTAGWSLALSAEEDIVPEKSLTPITYSQNQYSFTAPAEQGFYFIKLITPSGRLEYEVQIGILTDS